MIKTIIKSIYSAFISIVLLSFVLAVWTSYTFISQSSKSNEIKTVVKDIYSNQTSVILDVIDLSKILIKDTSETVDNENDNFSTETEFLTETFVKEQLDESSINEDYGNNPLGIVVEPSLPDSSENNLPEINEELLVLEDNEFSMN
tara:strand:+ start:13 stop:450 length:438 start_codon:yes stop_codon:yes gene_type:complete